MQTDSGKVPDARRNRDGRETMWMKNKAAHVPILGEDATESCVVHVYTHLYTRRETGRESVQKYV